MPEGVKKMVNIYDIEPEIVIQKAAEELKKTEHVKKPEWANFVKTSRARERLPVNEDWWYIRAASILRKMYIMNKPIGTNRLRNFYGGRRNRGHKPDRFYKGAGKIIRVILQQLEKVEYIKPVEKGVYKGRMITAKGKKFLDGLVKNEPK